MRIFTTIFLTFLVIGCFAQQSKYIDDEALPQNFDISETVLIYLTEETNKAWFEKKMKKKCPEVKYDVVIVPEKAMHNDTLSDGYRYIMKFIRGPMHRPAQYSNSGSYNSAVYNYSFIFRDTKLGSTHIWKNKYTMVSDTFGPAKRYLLYFIETLKTMEKK